MSERGAWSASGRRSVGQVFRKGVELLLSFWEKECEYRQSFWKNEVRIRKEEERGYDCIFMFVRGKKKKALFREKG